MKSFLFQKMGRRRAESRSQALTEFAIVLPIFLTLMCGVFDYGLMIANSQTLGIACREAANAASRTTSTNPLPIGLSAAVDAARPLVLLTNSNGGVIITSITSDTNTPPNLILSDVPTSACMSTGLIYGGGDALKNMSHIIPGGTTNSPAWQTTYRTTPFGASNLNPSATMYVVETFYTNSFVTPIGVLVGLVCPSVLYEAAYF